MVVGQTIKCQTLSNNLDVVLIKQCQIPPSLIYWAIDLFEHKQKNKNKKNLAQYLENNNIKQLDKLIK